MAAGFKSLLPVMQWIPHYDPAGVKNDLVAGITLAFFVIPTSMAYASLAGLPPESGIYCYLLAGIPYFLFGTSRQLAIGPTSSMSILLATSILPLSGGDPSVTLAMACFTALLTSGFFLLAYLIRLSTLVEFISDTILTGFKAGAALVIAASQLPALFGLEVTGSDLLRQTANLVTHLPQANIYVFLMGITALIILIAGNILLKGKPVSLAVVIISIIFVSITGLDREGIAVVGQIPEGLPGLHLVMPPAEKMNDLIFLALACFFLSYVESISAARSLAAERGYQVVPRQELLALGAANLASSLGGGYTVAGGLSQSTVNAKSGARSPFAIVFASVVLAMVLIFMTGFFRDLPRVILAAIVLEALIGLVNFRELKHYFRVNRPEFWLAVVTIAAVVVFGILRGILLAGILSLLAVIKRSSSPHIAILGKIPGTGLLSDIQRHPDNIPYDGILILRPESSILYFNVAYLREKIEMILSQTSTKPGLVIIDLSSSSFIDIAGARFFLKLEDDLEKQDILLRIVDALGNVRDMLRAEGLEKEIGHISRKTTIQEIIAEYQMNAG